MGPSKLAKPWWQRRHTRIELELRALPIASPAFLRPLQRRQVYSLLREPTRGSRRTEGLEAERRQRARRHSDKW